MRVISAASGVWQRSELQIGGDRSAADAALRMVIEKDAGISAYQIAEVYALRHDPKATLEWLDRALSNRDTGIQFLLYDPFILRYKDDPRFAAFCRRVGLPTPAEAAAHKTVAVIQKPRSGQYGTVVCRSAMQRRTSAPCTF